MDEKRPILNAVNFHITNRCNLHCKFCCYESGFKNVQEVTSDQAKLIISKIYKMGVKELHFTGGEPLLRKDIFDLISFGTNLGLEVRLQTNGLLLDPEKIQKLKHAKLRNIMFSIDGPKEIHNTLRGKSYAYDSAIKGILNARKAGFYTRINTVINSLNVDYLFNIYEIGVKLEVDKHSFFYMTPMGKARENIDLWVEPDLYYQQCDKLIKQITQHELSSSKRTKIIFEEAYKLKNEKINKNDFCRINNDHGGCNLVFCDGRVFPCVLSLEIPNSELGNILHEDFEAIWNKRKEAEILKPVDHVNCKKCNFYDNCSGGCPAYRYIWKNELNIPDPRCSYSDNLVPICPAIKTREIIKERSINCHKK